MTLRSSCPWHLHNSPLAAQGARFGGGKGGGGGTTYQTQTTQIPPEVRARYDAVNARAEQVAQQPFTPYTGQFVAPLTPIQAQGIEQIAQAGQNYQPYQQAATTALTGAAETALPFYQQAGENITQAQAMGQPYAGLATMAGLAGTQAVNPQALNIGAYQNPYVESVIAPTMAALRQQQQMEQSQLMGQQAMRGAFGGDRGSIAAANLARQQGLASAQTEAGLRSQAYQQALAAAQQQQGVGLGAAQANRAALQQFAPQALAIGQQAFQQPLAAAQAQQQLGQGVLGYGQGVAQGLTGIGQQGTQTGLAAGQALLGAGTLGQQTQQQLNAALYNQFLQQQGYPFQVAQFLANIALGTGPLYGSTTSGTTTVPTPFFSDERVKEDITEIGRTHDGQKIIKFRYKGEPEGTTHIGLSAQDVEKHHPEAVSETPEGIKAVDYDAATKHAERAYGGGLMPMSSEGGAVHPSMAGLGFADGGNADVEAMRKMYPWSAAGLPGKGAGWAPGLAVKPQAPLGSNVQFSRPSTPATGLSQALGAVKGTTGALEDAEKLGSAAKGAYDWLSDKWNLAGLDREAAANTAAGAPGLAHGGRTGYGDGGDAEDNPAIPYIAGTGTDDPLEKLTSKQVTPAKLDTPKLPGVAGGGGGGGSGVLGDIGAGLGAASSAANLISKLPALAAMFVARGGAIDADTMADAKRRIAGLESGGNYGALGPMVGGDRAHGKYQVMGRNIPSWTEEALGRRMTPEEFLKSPEAQERVFEHHFGKYLAQHGNLADAASMWHSGRPLAEARRAGARDVNMSTEDYVRKIMGGAPPAESIMREEPREAPRAAGLAPRITDVKDLNEEDEAGLAPVDTSEFRSLELPKKFQSGGLVGRHSYPTGGVAQVIDPDAVDPNNPDQVRILREQIQRAQGLSPAPTPAPAPTPTPAPSVDQVRTGGDRDLAGYNPPVPTGVAATPAAPQRDFLDRAGDWYDRNQNWVLPLVSGVGKMLASPSPFLGVAIGQGIAEAAPTALAANFKQQGLDISMMDRLGKQIGVLASDIALRGGPGMDPTLDKAQQAAMARYYRLSGVNYSPSLMDPTKVREQLASSPFAKLRFADNPDLLYRAAQTPGLPPEQKQQFLGQASEAAKRLADQGYGIDNDGQPVYFQNLNEALRNSLYGKAVASTAGSTAGAGVPGGPQYIANLEANIKVAQQEYQRALGLNNNNAQHPDVLAAQRRVQELQRDLQKALSPAVGRAYGGRTGYALDGAVDDAPESDTTYDNVQLAQATPSPTVPTMPTMPRPPSQAPAPSPRVPVEPSSQGMPGGAPKTAADYRQLHQTTLGLAPPTTSEMYLRRAEELEREAVGSGRQSTGTGVEVAPGAVQTKTTFDNAAYNTKWLQEQSQASQARQSVQNGLDVLTEALTHVNTNPLAQFSAKVSEYARALGFNTGTEAERAAAVQEIAKQVAQQAQGAGTDYARILTTQGSVEALKNPMANRAIMAQAYAKLDHDRARYDYFRKRLYDDRTQDPAKLQADFEAAEPIEKYYEKHYNRIALPGATPYTESGSLDWPRLKVGASYLITPKEWWNMSGGQKIDQPKRVKIIVGEDGRKTAVPE